MWGLRLWSSLWFCFFFFSLNLKQLSLLSLLLKTCLSWKLFVKLFHAHFSVCEHNPWTTKGRTGHGDVDAWQPHLMFVSAPRYSKALFLSPVPPHASWPPSCIFNIFVRSCFFSSFSYGISFTCSASPRSRTIPASDDVHIFLFTISSGPNFYTFWVEGLTGLKAIEQILENC